MELKTIIESLLFASPRPLSAEEIRRIFCGVADRSEDLEIKAYRKIKKEEIEQALLVLQEEHVNLERTWRLVCVDGAWQFVSLPEFAPWIRFLIGEKPRPPRLSPSALETLAIVAYRQPMTRTEMEEIRGVSVDGVIGTLLERKLVMQLGKADLPGRPTLYGTTPEFLQYFGLASLDDLPDAAELRRYAPEPLQTTSDTKGEKDEKEEGEAENAEPAEENASSEFSEGNSSPEPVEAELPLQPNPEEVSAPEATPEPGDVL